MSSPQFAPGEGRALRLEHQLEQLDGQNAMLVSVNRSMIDLYERQHVRDTEILKHLRELIGESQRLTAENKRLTAELDFLNRASTIKQTPFGRIDETAPQQQPQPQPEKGSQL
jgi:hypothetical protein